MHVGPTVCDVAGDGSTFHSAQSIFLRTWSSRHRSVEGCYTDDVGVGRELLAAACAGVMACGGPDPILDLGGHSLPPEKAIGATVVSNDGGCDFCLNDATLSDSAPPTELPPVLCPSSAPTLGTACDVPEYEDCEYGSSTSFFCDEIFNCLSGVWATSKPQCQATQPCDALVDGGACTSAGEACGAPDSGTVCVCMECGGGPPPPPGSDGAVSSGPAWRCFDPGTGCSSERANSGTACNLPSGSVCRFGGGCCSGVVEECEQGVWLAGPGVPCE